MVSRWLTYCVVFALIGLTACQAGSGHYLGALADRAGVIAIAPPLAGPQQWQDTHVIVESTLEQDERQYRFSGEVFFTFHSQAMYSRVTNATLILFLLDEADRVVAYQTLSRFMWQSPEERTPFSLTLDRVPGVVAYTFGYEATFVDDESVSYRQWSFPRTSR